ncbi:hypothetical protein [Candidatus Poriferisodalis sp.]|uniref:hypothetical protein n=1 Tax=Candidatus Poriferisodalis sp. TaxID=3101277 RepID=UPI003B5C5F00
MDAELRPAATSRRYSPEQKDQAVRMVLEVFLGGELGQRHVVQAGHGVFGERLVGLQ